MNSEEKQNMSGYEVCVERLKKIMDIEYSKKDEEVAKNLKTFKEKYYEIINSEIPLYEDGLPHQYQTISFTTKRIYMKDTRSVIIDFLKEEKWPIDKVQISDTFGSLNILLSYSDVNVTLF